MSSTEVDYLKDIPHIKEPISLSNILKTLKCLNVLEDAALNQVTWVVVLDILSSVPALNEDQIWVFNLLCVLNLNETIELVNN